MPKKDRLERIAQAQRNTLIWEANASWGCRVAAIARSLPLSGMALLLTRSVGVQAGNADRRSLLRLNFQMDLALSDLPQLYMYLFGVWEPSQTALIQRLLRPGRLFIDVGAHVGYYSLVAAALGGRALAIEPDPMATARLRTNVEINEFEDRVAVVEVAIASDSRGRDLYRGPQHNWGLTSTNPKWNLAVAQRVDSAPFSECVSQADLAMTQFVKVDVEGAEPSVIASIGGVAEYIPPDAVLLIELSPRWWNTSQSVHDVLRPLTESDFKVWSIENSYSPARYALPGRISAPSPIDRKLLSLKRRRYDLVLARDPSALSA